MATLKLKEENAIKAFNKGSESDKQLLKNLYPDYNFSTCIMDRVKSFEDACEVLGINGDNVPEEDHIIVIIAAINEGWEPNYDDSSEYKWRVWNKRENKGWSFFSSHFILVYSLAGSRLDIYSEAKANYVGKNFRKEWASYLDKTPKGYLERYK